MIRKFWIVLIAITLALPLVCGQAGAAVEVAKGGIGDVLLFPVYDVRDTGSGITSDSRGDGWHNYFTISNTSGQWTAFHLRLRSWRNCIEVYDHVVLLSPYDIFWFTVGYDEDNDRAFISSSDTETLFNSGIVENEDIVYTQYKSDEPGSGIKVEWNADHSSVGWRSDLQYSLLEECGFTTNLQEELKVGHVEVIGLWQLEVPVGRILGVPLPNGTEDVHDLGYVVRDVDNNGIINIFDVLDALYYEGELPANTLAPPFANELRSGNPIPSGQYPGWTLGCEDDNGLAGWTGNGEFVRIKGIDIEPLPTFLETTTQPGYQLTRHGLDCGNVLTGAFEMGDPSNGRYELGNAVALMNFRTNYSDLPEERQDPDNAAYIAPANFHRDQYREGAILFPNSAHPGYRGSVVYHAPAYYLQTDWATTLGPGLRDGDHDWTVNINALSAVGTCTLNHSINDIWSLDEVEDALAKTEIWYQYFNNEPFPGAGEMNTDVVLTFPTKYNHYFFQNWPWNHGGNSQGFYGLIKNFRGSIRTRLVALNHGPIDAFSQLWNTEQLTPPSPDVDDPRYGASPGTSSWPDIVADTQIPYEVNILRVGAARNVAADQNTVAECNGLLEIDGTNPSLTSEQVASLNQGHFNIRQFALTNGSRNFCFRAGDNTDYVGAYRLPPIGVVIFQHQIGGEATVRSALNEWHYK